MKLYIFIQQHHNHTLVATYTKPADGDKTITGCVAGQPLFFIHCVSGKGNPNDPGFAWCYIRPTKGCVHVNSSQHHYQIGSASWNEYAHGTTNIMVVIPNATSVTVNIGDASTDDIIYVFKQ